MLGKPLVANENPGGEYVDHTVLDPNSDDVEAWLSSTARRRVSTATTICVFITALLVISVGSIGGVYLYRQFSHTQMTRFRGWCGIPYDRSALHLIPERLSAQHIPKIPYGVIEHGVDQEMTDVEYGKLPEETDFSSIMSGPETFLESEPESTTVSPYGNSPQVHLFKEEFDLDLEEESYEEIQVPDFGIGRRGGFIHDFKQNTTGIIDYTDRQCFVMPLDRNHVVAPRGLLDLIQNMFMGYYQVDTEVVRETTRVVYPPVEDLHSLGKYIEKNCRDFKTYKLERIYTPELRKRSVDTQEQIELVEFAGKKIVNYVITFPQE